MRTPMSSSRRDLRVRSMSSDTRATTVVNQPPRFSTLFGPERLQAQPGLLHGVLRVSQRAQHPVGHAAQVGAVGLELLRGGLVALGPTLWSGAWICARGRLASS